MALKLIHKCPCGCVAARVVWIDNKKLNVCQKCEPKAYVKLLQMSLMVVKGTNVKVADRWS